MGICYTPIKEANEQQRIASCPDRSSFVSASAGSGKTKLLVDRLLRLMLPYRTEDGKFYLGTSPDRIQCLTYTKAAATEMIIRLQQRLSDWVGRSDAQLEQALTELNVIADKETKKQARALFARVLDLPGGMRIETNHAFCQCLLQKFPKEAEISPRFKIIDEVENKLVFSQALEKGITKVFSHNIECLSTVIEKKNVLEILQQLQKNAHDVHCVFELMDKGIFEACLQKNLGLQYRDKKDYIRRFCQDICSNNALKECLKKASSAKGEKLQQLSLKCNGWINKNSFDQEKHIAEWIKFFLTDTKKTRSIKGTKEDDSTIVDFLEKYAKDVENFHYKLNAYEIFDYTIALFHIVKPIWEYYHKVKKNDGVLNYEDLISCTLKLLENPGSAWILFKLDGGIDHILLDEVQDNSSEQWKIILELSSDFFSSISSNKDVIRTIFAVGDFKQSIYSFQGAKPQEFLKARDNFRSKVQNAQQSWADPQLRVSFRSSQIILDFVDQVCWSEKKLPGLLLCENDQFKHLSAQTDAPGRVDIWPILKIDSSEVATKDNLWKPKRENKFNPNAEWILADTLAIWLKSNIGNAPPYGGKPLQAGDILILVRKRTSFSTALIRSLKKHNVPLANLVKTLLLDQLAVQDLLVLCEVLLLPQDDLSLACVLKSPLGGLEEESLMELAAPRNSGQSLWQTLSLRSEEREEWSNAWKMLSALFSRVDYVTPYGLLVEILGEHRGRTNLILRLGSEAIEAIDELLSKALQYESTKAPSLQGFLHWLKQSECSVKNESEANSGMVRLMTVHGAKGLQARLVILPDALNSFSERKEGQRVLWKNDPDIKVKIPFYIPHRDFRIPEYYSCQAERNDLEKDESNRLLYVALTRASEWLLICGSQSSAKNNNNYSHQWYTLTLQAIKELSSQSCVFTENYWVGKHFWIEKKIENEENQTEMVISDPKRTIESICLPKWMGRERGWIPEYLMSESKTISSLAPSRPEHLGSIPSLVSPLQVKNGKDPFYRGRLIHQLLQYLPDCSADKRYQIAQSWLTQFKNKYTYHEIEKIIHQVMNIMNVPELKSLFDNQSLSEQPLTGVVNGVVVMGQIDRMRILSDKILLCDFKSGRKIPKTVDQVPLIYLKQMAAYWILLKEIYPAHIIKPFIIWTDEAKVMFLPLELLSQYIPSKKDKVS